MVNMLKRVINYTCFILSLTLILCGVFCGYEWYTLVYHTVICFAPPGTKLQKALFYEDIFDKVLTSLYFSTFIIGGYFLIRKVIKRKSSQAT